MGMRKKTIGAKDYAGPKRLPNSDSVNPHLRTKPRKMKKGRRQ